MLYNQPFDKPPEVTYGDTPYVNGNPATGTPGSIPSAASIEYPQREIVNLIRDSGLATPTNSDLHQLAKAVQSTLLYSDDDAGTINQYQTTQTPAPTAYFKYMTVVMKIGNTNGGASTLNVNALGPKPIRHLDGTELASGEVKANSICCFVFDGTIFQLVWTSAGLSGGGPIFLITNRDLYVNSSTGLDTYDGSSATVVGGGTNKGPFLTMQRAANEVKKYNLNGFQLTVHVAAGSYDGSQITMPGGSGQLAYIGSGNTTCNINAANKTAFNVNGAGSFLVQGFKITTSGLSPGDPICGIFTALANRANIMDCEFGSCAGAHIGISRSSSMQLSGNITISGPSTGAGGMSPGFVQCYYNSLVETSPPTAPINIVASSGPFSVGIFVYATQFGAINLTWTSFTGAANITGTRYSATMNGVINSGGGGVNYYPGTIAGSTATGGQYA